MDVHKALGVVRGSPQQRLARDLVRGDARLIEELVEQRRVRRMSQNDVGQLMGIGQSAVARLESGTRDVHLSTLRRYAWAVGAMIRHEVHRHDPATASVAAQLAADPWGFEADAAELARHAARARALAGRS